MDLRTAPICAAGRAVANFSARSTAFSNPVGRLGCRDIEVVRRPRCSLEEEKRTALLLFERLGCQAVERRRANARLVRADRVRRVVEEDGLERLIGPAKRQHGQLGIERAGRSDGVIPAADPVNRAVTQQQPAVLADRRLFAQPEQERRSDQADCGRSLAAWTILSSTWRVKASSRE